jgi:hypothetical protein
MTWVASGLSLLPMLLTPASGSSRLSLQDRYARAVRCLWLSSSEELDGAGADELWLVDVHDVARSGEDLDFAVGDLPRALGCGRRAADESVPRAEEQQGW